MKAKVIGLDGAESGEIELSLQFFDYRPEVIHKVYVNVAFASVSKTGRYLQLARLVLNPCRTWD